MKRLWKICVVLAVGLIVGAGCAEVEPPGDNDGDNDEPVVDAGGDVEADTWDPCQECGPGEVCVDEECVDGCEETATECGSVDYMGEQLECGSCELGDCDDGQCPAVCEEFDAECGEVHFGGEAHDCGECEADDRRCTEHNVCISDASDIYVDVAAGRSHTCAVRGSGSVRCWGANDKGQLGDGQAPEGATSPSTVVDLAGARLVSTLNHHSCAASRDAEGQLRELYCWGPNEHGQLGDGTTDESDRPVEVDGLEGPSVRAGAEHTCGIDEAGGLFCWGRNEMGRLGGGHDDATDPSDNIEVLRLISPEQPLEDVVDHGAGTAHSCALDAGNEIRCWGRNTDGQLGLGHTGDGPTFAEEAVELPIVTTAIDTGYEHSCALGHQGEVWCWGRGEYGRLGHGEGVPEPSPVSVELDVAAVDVAAGRFHSCAAVESGEVYCWGRNHEGQVGLEGSATEIQVPQRVEGVDGVHRVGAGANHSCGVDFQGDVYCWGANDEGQLGDGSTVGRADPEPVE